MTEPLPRLIPVLLMRDDKLVKTVGFGDETYVGDPVNVVSIFNDLEVDEIFLTDIGRARNPRQDERPSLARVLSECFAPLAFGGGIQSADEAESIVGSGVEKVVVNSLIFAKPAEVHEMVRRLGSQAVVAAIDVRLSGTGEYEIWSRGGTRHESITVEQWCDVVTEIGVGEILVTNIDREGTRQGLDVSLVRKISSLVGVPVIAHGGAGRRSDLVEPVIIGGASAVAAGSLFLFQGSRDSVLVNYPSHDEILRLFSQLPIDPSGVFDSAALAWKPQPAQSQVSSLRKERMCVRCIITESVPGANFDEAGVCEYCHVHDRLDEQSALGAVADRAMDEFVAMLKREGQGKKYDCVMGVSGGTDSSYLAHLLVKKGVRPLAVHFDNTWNSPTATSNLHAVLGKLDVDLETYVVDNEEYDDIYLSFLKAGVKDIEAPTDIGFMGTLYRAAERHGIKHIVEGHSFRTEGISPLGWLYMDGGYISDVHRKFGSVPMATFPNMSFWQFIRWSVFSGIKRTRPLYWVDYQKEDVKKFLAREYGWKWYGGHHLENRFTAFYHSYFLPTRFGINFRQIELSALVRSGQVARSAAIDQYAAAREGDPELIALVKKRLRLSDNDFQELMNLPKQSYQAFRTYKRRFELLRPLFWVLLKLKRVPESFYLKFCTRL